MRKLKVVLSILLLLILSLGALGGGGFLIADPSGELIGISSDFLESTAFNSFLLPGIILFMILGLIPIFIIIWTIIRGKHYKWFIVAQGAILIGWLSIELMINIEFFLPLLHYPLYSVAVLLMLLGFSIKKENPKSF